MKFKKEKLNKFEKGFTLVEVLIGIFLLFTILSASTALVVKSLSSTPVTKSKLIAAYLAQEGIELVRNIRDNNWVAGRIWNDGLPTGERQIDYINRGLLLGAGKLNIDTNGFYNHTIGGPTIFSRIIKIEPTSDDGLRVTSTVSWSQKGIPYNIFAIEEMYNWYNVSP